MINKNIEKKDILTLGVPTYNRKDAIIFNSKQIIDEVCRLGVNYLVVDNASEDGTFDLLNEEFGNLSNFKLFKNTQNLQFFGNFIEVIKKCETKYLLISSDEDCFIMDEILDLIVFLEKKNPVFVSCEVDIDGKRYRGTGAREKIKSNGIRDSSNYISGLVFNCDVILKYIHILESNVSNQMVYLYPQVVLSVICLALGDCYNYDKKLTNKKFNCATNIIDKNGKEYFSLTSRVDQIRDFDYILDDITKLFELDSEFLSNTKKGNLEQAFGVVRNSMVDDHEKLRLFDEAASFFYLKAMVKRPFHTSMLVLNKIFKK